MYNENMISPQGENLNNAPLGGEPVNPTTGLQFGKDFKIDVDKVKANKALYRNDLVGAINTEDLIVPKSIYRILGDEYHPEFDPEYNAKLLSASQTNAGKFVAALNQAVIGEVVGGTLEGLSYLIDLPMALDLAEGTEQEFGNAFTDFAKRLGTWTEEVTPIYTDPTAPKFNPTSFEWWMKNAPSVASSISLALPAIGGMKAVSAVGKLVGLTEEMGKLGKYSKLFSTAFGQAIMSRHMESLMEAQGVYDQGMNEATSKLYEKYKDQIDAEIKSLPLFTPVDPETGPKPGQYTEEQYKKDLNKIANKWYSVIKQEATQYAASGAANTYSKNWVMLLQDIPEYMLLGRLLKPGANKIAQDAVEKSGKVAKRLNLSMPKFYGNKTAKFIGNMAAEGLVEENYQFLVNEQSSRMIRNLDNPDKKDSLLEVIKDNYDNGELWTNVFFGAIGAGVMQASMAGLNAKAFAESGKARVNNINTWSNLVHKLQSDIVSSESEGSKSDYDAAIENFLGVSAIKAYEYGNIEHYKNMISALANDDQNVLANYEMSSEARQFFKTRKDVTDRLIDKTDNLIKRYKDAMIEVTSKGVNEKEAKTYARSIAHSNYMLDFLNKRVNETREELGNLQIQGYNKPTSENELLSDIGKQIFDLRHEKLVLNNRLQSIENKQKSPKLTESEKLTQEKVVNRVKKRIKDIDTRLSELSKDKTLSTEQKKIDEKLLGTEDKTDGVISQTDVNEYINKQSDLQSYERGVESFKDTLEEVRTEVEAKSKVKAKVSETKPQVPTDEDSHSLYPGATVLYKSKDGKQRTGIVENIEYATKDQQGNDIIPTSESVENLYTIKDVETGELTHVYGASVLPATEEVKEIIHAGEAVDDTDDLDEQLDPVVDKEAVNRKDENRRRTNSPSTLKEDHGLIEFLSWAHYDENVKEGELPKLIIHDKKLNKFISNPDNQKFLPEAVASYSIDLKNKDFISKLNKVRKEKGMKRIPIDLLDKWEAYAKGEGKLTKDDIDLLLSTGPYFRGMLPISVKLTINNKTFDEGLFLHTLAKNEGSFHNPALREVYDKMRTSIIRHLLNGESVHTKGFNTNRGNPLNIDKTNSHKERGKNVAETFGIPSNKIELFVLKSSMSSAKNRKGNDGKWLKGSYFRPTLYRDSQTPYDAELDFASNGSVFMITKKTVNGQPFAIKLNKSFISKDHAKIIFNAFSTLAKTELDKKGNIKPEKLDRTGKRKDIGFYGSKVNPNIKDEEKDGVTSNISAGELLQLLVVHGETATDVDSSRYEYVNELKGMSDGHKLALKSKRLFLQRGYDQNGIVNGIYLCYGVSDTAYPIPTSQKGVTKQVDYNRINLTDNRTSVSEQSAYHTQIGNFLGWLTTNKTYAVHLENPRLNLKLNGNFLSGKSFRIGKKGITVIPSNVVSKRYNYTVDSEIIRKPNESYVEFLINNNLVTTDIKADKSGQLFDSPFIHLGFNQDAKKDFGIITGDPTNIVTETKIDESHVEVNEEEKTIKETKTKSKKSTGKKKTTREVLGGDELVTRERKQSIRKPYDRQDLEKELAWVRAKVNIDDDAIEIEKRLSNMMLNGRKAWAIYSHAAIKLYEAAETGTLYHEAFHRVSLGYFRKEEREIFYRSARQVYNMPKEEFTDKQVEEKLAEEFRTFVLTKQKETQPSVIKRIFKAIYDFINALFFGRNRLTHGDIERLFNQIYSGKYRFSRVRTENFNTEARLREVAGVNFETINTYDDVTDYTKYLVKKLISVHKIPVGDITAINKIKSKDLWNKLINNINNTILNLQEIIDDPEQSEVEINSALKSQTILKDIIGVPNEEGEYEKFFAFRYYILRYLRSMGIIHRESTNEDEDIFESKEYDNDIPEEDKSSKGNVYNQVDHLKSVKDNALASIKFIINTLHASEDVNESSGLVPYADGNKVWGRLLNDIIKYDDIFDMINEIKRIGEENDYYPYIELADFLSTASETIQTQFQITFEAHKHEFLNALFFKEGEGKGIDIRFDVAAHDRLAKDRARMWNEFIKYDNNIIDMETNVDDTGVARIRNVNKKFFDDLADLYNIEVKEYYDNTSKFGKRKLSDKQLEKLFSKISTILSKMHIDVSTDVVRRYTHNINPSKNLQDNLYALVENILNIISIETIKEVTPGVGVGYEIKSILKNAKVLMLADAYADVNTHEELGITLGPDGATFYKYGRLNYATDILRKVKRNLEWSDEKLTRLGNKHSLILNSFKDDAIRNKFGLMTMNAFKSGWGHDTGREFLKINPVEDYLLKAYAIQSGYLPFPVMANRGTYPFMKGVNAVGISTTDQLNNVIDWSKEDGTVKFSDKVLDIFYGYYLDEKERIDVAKETRADFIKENDELEKTKKEPGANIKEIENKQRDLRNKLVRNYHYTGKIDKNGLSKGNAYYFIHFKGFDGLTKPEEIRNKINEELNERLKEEIELCEELSIINVDRTKDSLLLAPKLFSEKLTSLYNNLDMPSNFSTLSILAQTMINTSISVIECEKMFLGDPALFKRNKGGAKEDKNFDVYVEVYKRWFGVGSTGTKLRSKFKNRPNTYNASVLKTQKFPYNGLGPLIEKHTELYKEMLSNRLKDATKTQINKEAKDLAINRLAKYNEVDPTDGASYISPDMYKDILDRMGLWYNDGGRKQKAFDLLQSDKKLTSEEILAASNIVFSPLKTQYFGHHNYNGIDLLIYDKTAMFTLFRQHVKDTMLEEILDRMELKGKYANKGLKKIDVYIYDSAKKGPSLNGISLFDNPVTRDKVTDLSDSFIFEQSFDYLKHQQVIDPHDSIKQNFGTAGIKIAMTDNVKDKPYGKFKTGEDLLNALSEARVAISNFGTHKVNAKFGIYKGRVSNTTFITMLRHNAEAANKSQDFVDALRTDEDGKKYLELDAFNDRRWIYSCIKTIVDENAVDLTTPGNQLVQMPDYGMPYADYKSELNSTRFDDGVREMECRVSIRLFKNFFPKNYTITKDDINKLLKDNPLIFGYRVPTQGQNSIMKLKIVDLLPEQCGDIIQLPLEFTTVTGSDFDIDKLFVSLYNFNKKYDKDGIFIGLEKIEYSEDDDKVEDRYKNKVLELTNLYRFSKKVFGNFFDTKKLSQSFKSIVDPTMDYEEYNSLQSRANSIVNELSKIYDPTTPRAMYLREILSTLYLRLQEIEEKIQNQNSSELTLKDLESVEDFNTIKDALIKSDILPTLENFGKLNVSEQNTLKANQNRLLDIIFTVLSDEKHFINMTTPLGTMTDILEDKSDYYDKVYSKRSNNNLPALATTTPAFQSRTKEKFSSSTFGIAPYSLHNNHHPLTQMANVRMATHLDIGKDGYIDLSQTIGEDNMYISWWISALMDIHVDGVNKPIAAPLNINEVTHDLVNLLIRAGVGETTFDFIASPVLKDYAINFQKASKKKNTISTIPDRNIIKYVYSIYRELAINNKLFNDKELGEDSFSKDIVIPLSELLNSEQLQADAKFYNNIKGRDRNWYLRQFSILAHLSDLLDDAADLRNFVLACRVDTTKYGANPVMIRHFITSIRNIINKKLSGTDIQKFENIEKILTANPQYEYKIGDTFLPILVKNSMFKIFDILKNDSLYSSLGFGRILEELVNITDHGDYNRAGVLNILSEELVTYFFSKFFADPVNGFGMDFTKLSNLIFEHSKDNIYEKIVQLKTGNHKLSDKVKNNLFLESIIVDNSDNLFHDKDGNGIPYTYILPRFRSLRNDLDKDEIVNSFKQLIYNDEKELRELGVNLYLYSFYTSAFRNKKFSFTSWLPIVLNREIEYNGEIKSLNNYIQKLLTKLNDPIGYIEYLNDAKREVFTNLASNQELIPHFSPKMRSMSVDSATGTVISLSLRYDNLNVRPLWIGKNDYKQNIFMPFIIDEDTNLLYQYVGYDRVTNNPYYVVIPKKGFGNKGLMIHELGITLNKGKDRSIIMTNNPTENWYSIEDQIKFLTKELSQDQFDNLELVPFNTQNVVEGPAYETDFSTTDGAATMRDEARKNMEIENAQKEELAKTRKGFDTKALDKAIENANNILKESTNNKTTKNHPIHIYVDGSSKGFASKGVNAVLGAGAYAKLQNKEYFLRVDNDTMRNWITTTLKSKGQVIKENANNDVAELFALLNVLDSFKDTSEHVYIHQDYAGALMYFLKNAVNPTEASKYPTTQWKDPVDDTNRMLIENIRNRIAKIESNGGSVKIEYIKTKSTAEALLSDKLAKGEHEIKDVRNDFKADKTWGKAVVINKLSVANIPQNRVSGIESQGSIQEAILEAKKLLGNNPHSIDMIEIGLRTRTTRSVGEMEKYKIKVGDIVTQFGKSADGTTKQIRTKITAIHLKGTPGFLGTWSKEGWTQEGVKDIERYKNGAAAIEFEVIGKTSSSNVSANSKDINDAIDQTNKCNK